MLSTELVSLQCSGVYFQVPSVSNLYYLPFRSYLLSPLLGKEGHQYNPQYDGHVFLIPLPSSSFSPPYCLVSHA